MSKRSNKGRALFYTRDSGGRHEMTPGQYLAPDMLQRLEDPLDADRRGRGS